MRSEKLAIWLNAAATLTSQKDGPAVFMHFKNFKKQENNGTGKKDANT